jgi:hypothetical protein
MSKGPQPTNCYRALSNARKAIYTNGVTGPVAETVLSLVHEIEHGYNRTFRATRSLEQIEARRAQQRARKRLLYEQDPGTYRERSHAYAAAHRAENRAYQRARRAAQRFSLMEQPDGPAN